MPRVLWTPTALRDVARLHRFLTGDNPAAARRCISVIRSRVKQLGANPDLGRHVAEMPTEFRELIIPFGKSAYLALYRTDDATVAILAVRHAREAGY